MRGPLHSLLMTAGLALIVALAMRSFAAPAPSVKGVPEKLLVDRLGTARKGLAAAEDEYRAGKGTLEQVFLWSQRVLEAELALTAKKADRIAAHMRLVKLAKQLEETARARHDAGRALIQEVLDASYRRIEAEIALTRAEAE